MFQFASSPYMPICLELADIFAKTSLFRSFIAELWVNSLFLSGWKSGCTS